MAISLFKSSEYHFLPIPFFLLTIWGIWCPIRKYNIPLIKKVFRIYGFSVITVLSILTIETFIQVLMSMKNSNFDLDTFFVMISMANGTYKALVILFSHDEIYILVKMAYENRWITAKDEKEQKLIGAFYSRSWKVLLMYAIALIVGVSMKLIGPMMKSHSEIQLPVAAWTPYNRNKTINFWLTYFHQMLCGSAVIAMHIGADTLLCGLMIQNCLQLELLKYRIQNRIHDSNNRSELIAERQIIQYILDHQMIYRLTQKMNKQLSGWLLANVMVVIPNTCINVYLLSFTEAGLNVDFTTSAVFFCLSLFQIFLPCWYGNEVLINSQSVARAIYELEWTDLPTTSKKQILFMMKRADKPVVFIVAHIITMNIPTFLAILRASYSAFSLLKQMK